MRLGRACAAGAVLWAVALPLTAGTALADQEPPVAERSSAPSEAAPPSAVPDGSGPVTVGVPPRDAQVPVRPEGAPETGGGPEEPGIGLAVTGGAAAVVAAGGAVLVLRRRRAGTR